MEKILSAIIFTIIFVPLIGIVFWIKIIDLFLFIFVPEKILVQGIVMNLKEEDAFVPSAMAGNYIFYLMDVQTSNEDTITVEVTKDFFEKISIGDTINVLCKKNAWEKDLVVIKL